MRMIAIVQMRALLACTDRLAYKDQGGTCEFVFTYGRMQMSQFGDEFGKFYEKKCAKAIKNVRETFSLCSMEYATFDT